MNIRDLINEDQEAWVRSPVDPAFEVKIKFASREAISRMQKNATTSKFNSKIKQAVEEVDDERFMFEFVQHCVRDWRGLNVAIMSEMVLLDPDKAAANADVEVPFSVEDAVHLIKHDTTNFGDWLLEAVRDLENFTKSTSKPANE